MYIDLLIRIKNAQAAGKERAKVFYSKMDMAVAEILAKHKFIESAEKRGRMPKRVIDLKLAPKAAAEGGIRGLRIVSTPGRRIYKGYKKLKPIKSNYGISVLSTPKGILTNKEARKEKVGGEVLFEVW